MHDFLCTFGRSSSPDGRFWTAEPGYVLNSYFSAEQRPFRTFWSNKKPEIGFKRSSGSMLSWIIYSIPVIYSAKVVSLGLTNMKLTIFVFVEMWWKKEGWNGAAFGWVYARRKCFYLWRRLIRSGSKGVCRYQEPGISQLKYAGCMCSIWKMIRIFCIRFLVVLTFEKRQKDVIENPKTSTKPVGG